MCLPQRDDWRELLIEQARTLDEAGHFSQYSAAQRAAVLEKGYVGVYPPDEAIRIARAEVEAGWALRKPQYIDNMRDHFQLDGLEEREATRSVVSEMRPAHYCPPGELRVPPGIPLVFESAVLGARVYFKFQIVGDDKRRQVLLWSCHPPVY